MSTKQEQQLLKLIIEVHLLWHYTQHFGRKKIGGSSKLHSCFSKTYEQYFSITSSTICCTTAIHITQDTRMI